MTQVIVTTPDEIRAIFREELAQAGPSALPGEVVELEILKRREYLTTEEVALLYPLKANTLRKHRMNGTGPAYSKDGDKVTYSQTAIRKYLESRRQKTHDQP